jgi:ferric-dicitrate binding protein FerR (iron transport regulator)
MKQLFKKYFSSTLRPDEFGEFAKFVLDKRNEAAVYNEMKPFWNQNLAETEGLPENNPALLQQIKLAILRDERKYAQRKLKIYSIGLSVAAILVVGLIISTVFFYVQPRQNQFTEQIQTISTPFGARTATQLPDGSKVWLNSGSSLSFPSGFGDNRAVELTGEAFFEVEKSDKTFVVSTQYGEVKVQGTSFNVKAFADDPNFETTLVEGSVILTGKQAGTETTLQPGQQATLVNNSFVVQPVEVKFFTSWKDGKLIFSREPFPQFIKKLERWYNVKIEYSDPKLDKLWYTGTIEMESISEVMEMISKAAPVKTSFDNKTRVFTIKMI